MVSSSTHPSAPPPHRARRQRPHLARLSALIPSSWSRKVQVINVSPPETPLRSLLIPTEACEDKDSKPTPMFVEPERTHVERLASRCTPLTTPTSARSPALGLYHPRSASSGYPSSSLDEREVLQTPHLSVDYAPHRRSNSCSGSKSSGIWLCSPPTGKRAERPLVVRSSSTKSNEGRAKDVDYAARNIEPQDCMSLHRAVTALEVPAEPSPRRSLDGDIAAGIYRLEVETPRYAPASAPPTRSYPGLSLGPPRVAPMLYAH